MNKVLITGGSGYIGTILTELLLHKGYKVTILDNLMYKQLSLLHLISHANLNFVMGDVRDEKLLESLVKENDIIIPLAAIVGKGFTSYYKNFIHLNGNATEQRKTFESKMQQYLNEGIKHLYDKGILK